MLGMGVVLEDGEFGVSSSSCRHWEIALCHAASHARAQPLWAEVLAQSGGYCDGVAGYSQCDQRTSDSGSLDVVGSLLVFVKCRFCIVTTTLLNLAPIELGTP